MPTFLEKSNCRGTKPAKVLGKKHYSRPEILVKLLQDRHVARLLRAPVGSGKSSLVFEYTNIVFGFNHVFWIDCTSPCFLRDLDDDSMYRALMRIDADTKLIVFEDVPLLDQQRTDNLNSLVDGLLEKKIEVVLTCTPASDTFSRYQRDAIILTADDLLLTDLEMENEEAAGLLGGKRAEEMSPQERIACVRWSDHGHQQILTGLSAEEVDWETKLAMLAMLLLREGSVDSLKELMMSDRAKSVVRTIAESYICFGVDTRLMTFRTIDCSVSDIAAYFCKDISGLGSASVYKDKDNLCMGIARMLLAQGEHRRACDFLVQNAERPCGITWLCDNGMALLHNGYADSLLYLYESTKRAVGKERDQTDILVMLALFQVEDVFGMATVGKRILRSRTLPSSAKAAAASLMLRHIAAYPKLAASQKVDEMHARLQEAGEGDPLGQPAGIRFNLALLADLSRALESSPQDLMMRIAEHLEAIERSEAPAQEHEGSEDALLLGISWLFETMDAHDPLMPDMHTELLGVSSATDEYLEHYTALKRIFEHIGTAIEQAHELESAGFYLYRAARAFRRIDAKVIDMLEVHRDKRHLAFFDKLDSKYMEQRDAYRQHQKHDKDSKREYLLTHPDVFRRDGISPSHERAAHTSVPTLRVKLFGCMEVRIGDDMVDPKKVYRKKTKTLIALLVLGRNRECARDQLAEELWPETNITSARRNFYTVVAELKKALSFEGSCPYLIRTQTGYRFDTRLVTSDVYEFEDVCRSLLFDKTEAPEWEHLYATVTKDYSGMLMPSEMENETIISLRKRFNLQLVDGLIATSTRLINDGQQRGALWFAREALNHDDKREDVYIALMEAQVACEQRGEALDTYFRCVSFLNEELGIDPSIRLVELYRSIIETEEDF